MKKKREVLLIGILGIIFLTLGIMVRNSTEGILFDMAILNFLHSNFSPVLFSFMKSISFIGSEKFLFPVVGLVIIYTLIKKRYYISKFLLANTLGSFILNQILKQIYNRTRPLDFILVKQGGLSFPSGHSMVTMSMYLSIAYLITRGRKIKLKEKTIYMIAISMILLMGISRVYLGVHWPTDILGGYIGGYIVFYLSNIIIKENKE